LSNGCAIGKNGFPNIPNTTATVLARADHDPREQPYSNKTGGAGGGCCLSA
jgi:hypothetical protein